MTDTTTTNTRRSRNGGTILTDRLCERRVTARVKIYDRKCPGLYLSITTAGVATFSFKFTDPETGKQRTGWLGVYNPETFAVEDARSRVYALKGRGGAAVAETLRRQRVQTRRQGKTVAEAVEERIAWHQRMLKLAALLFRRPLSARSSEARFFRLASASQ